MKTYTAIEALESRIAPAAIFTFTDVDGDLVTVKTSKGTNAELTAVITKSTPAGSVNGGESLDLINLAMNSKFDGTDISIIATPGPLGGNALVDVVRINATGLDLGTVKIGGDLVDIDAGKNNLASKIKSIDVKSTSGSESWKLNASVGSIKVARDLRGAEIDMLMPGATLGLLHVGGSLIGESPFVQTGFVKVSNGTIGKVIINGDIIGATSIRSGSISAKDIGSVSIGGGIFGGSGAESGALSATNSLGPITIKGDVLGGTGANSGYIHSDGKLGNVTIGGSLGGGSAEFSGTIKGVNGIGKVSIGRDVRGGGANDTGDIQSTAGGIAGVKIGGSLIGGTGSASGRIVALGGDIGPIQIGGDLASSYSPTGAMLTDNGIIFALIGSTSDANAAKIASITIGGSVRGASSTSAGQIFADGAIGAVKIGRSMFGGQGAGSALLQSNAGIASVTIGGDVLGGSGEASGCVISHGALGSIKIGGSLIGGTSASSGVITATGKLGSVTVGGDVIGNAVGTGTIGSSISIGAVKIGGSLVGNTAFSAAVYVSGDNPALATIKSITIGGRVERAYIGITNPDSQIGSVKVGGDWIASDLVTAAIRGVDSEYGTADDLGLTVNPALFSKIASITIGGQVKGTVGGTDHFGFVSEEIGSLKINGVTIPLAKGRGNDTDVNNTQHILGATRDVTIHEVL